MANSPQVPPGVDPIHARYIELDESCRRVGTSIPRIIDQAVMIELWIEDEIGGGGTRPPRRTSLWEKLQASMRSRSHAAAR